MSFKCIHESRWLDPALNFKFEEVVQAFFVRHLRLDDFDKM